MGPLQVVKLLLMIFIMAHWLSCGWYYFGDDDGSAKDSDGNVIQGWAKKQFSGEADAGDYIKYVCHLRFSSLLVGRVIHSIKMRQVTSYYWSMMTLTTVSRVDG